MAVQTRRASGALPVSKPTAPTEPTGHPARGVAAKKKAKKRKGKRAVQRTRTTKSTPAKTTGRTNYKLGKVSPVPLPKCAHYQPTPQEDRTAMDHLVRAASIFLAETSRDKMEAAEGLLELSRSS